MTKAEKNFWINEPTMAYYSGLNGLEFKGVSYGIDDYIISVSGAWGGHKQVHYTRIDCTASGRLFTRVHGYKIYLDECLRTGI